MLEHRLSEKLIQIGYFFPVQFTHKICTPLGSFRLNSIQRRRRIDTLLRKPSTAGNAR